jgi:hypothetical protein
VTCRTVALLVVVALSACADGPLWPYHRGDTFSGLVVQQESYLCGDLDGFPLPPDSLLCVAGDTTSVLLSVDSLHVDLMLGEGRPPTSDVPGRHLWYQGSATFTLEITATLRRCLAGGACEDAGVAGSGEMERRVYYCPLVDEADFLGAGSYIVLPPDCAGRAGDTVVVVTVDLGPETGLIYWQRVLIGEETANGGMSGQDSFVTSRTESRHVWFLKPSSR